MNTVAGLFEAGQFDHLITLFSERERTAREQTLYGLALLYTGRLEDAEFALNRASVLGDPEAQVELGNTLRLLGRFDEAASHLQAVAGNLSGELQLRALRWWGVAEFQAGQASDGLKRVERAWHGYIALGNEEWTARVTVSLAQMYTLLGNTRRARRLLADAVEILPDLPDPAPRLSALKALAELEVAQGNFREAQDTLNAASQTLRVADSPRLRALLLSTEAECARLSGQPSAYLALVEELHLQAGDLQDYGLRVWSVSRLAECHSLTGQHGLALSTLLGFGCLPEQWPAELWATSGVLARRRGDFTSAVNDLSRAAQLLRDAGSVAELVRVQLHLAAAALSLNDEERVVTSLREALTHLLRLRLLNELRPDLEELSELLHYAVLEPETAPYMESLLDNLANLAGAPRLPEDGCLTVQVTTLGRTAVHVGGQEVMFTYAGTIPLLAYLALKPGQTRAQMQLDLYPEKDAKSGAAYMRQSLKELRDTLGSQVLQFSGPHQAPRYTLGRGVQVELDTQHLRQSLERGEIARALALYRGPFLPHLEESEWAKHLRDELALSLIFELREQIAGYQTAGDERRVVLLANQYLRIDPYQAEVLHARIKAAQGFASAHELARYTADLRQMSN